MIVDEYNLELYSSTTGYAQLNIYTDEREHDESVNATIRQIGRCYFTL